MNKILWLFFSFFSFLSKSTKQNLSNGLYNIILNNNYLNYVKNKLQFSSSKRLEGKSIFRKIKIIKFLICSKIK